MIKFLAILVAILTPVASVMTVTLMLVKAGFHTDAQSAATGPGATEIISTSNEDGAPSPHYATAGVGNGPLMLRSIIGGRWTATESARVTLQVSLTNPSNVPIRLDEVRAAFKRGARPDAPTEYIERRGNFVVAPGTTQSLWLHYDNPQNFERVSVDLNVAYDVSGKQYVQHGFIKGDVKQSSFDRMNKLFNGPLPVPTGLGNYPILTGPLFPWPSPYDVLVSPTSKILKVQF